MITEADALDLAQVDANLVHKKIEKGAMPDALGKLAVKLFLRRIDSLEDRTASDRAREGAVQRLSAPTMSEFTLAQMMNIFGKAMTRLPPEDTRALILWLNGTPPQAPGFLRHMVNLLGETSGEQAIANCEAQLGAMVQRMQQADTALFEIKLKELNAPRRRIIRGFLLQSQWAFQERDGITARNHVIRARRLTLRWLKEAERNKRAGF